MVQKDRDRPEVSKDTGRSRPGHTVPLHGLREHLSGLGSGEELFTQLEQLRQNEHRRGQASQQQQVCGERVPDISAHLQATSHGPCLPLQSNRLAGGEGAEGKGLASLEEPRVLL